MAVNINTVYQRVLTIANKEQRGYITPQEFNILANQAQMDIFEQYFYDLNQSLRLHGNDTHNADPVEILKEKISIFEKQGANVTSGTTLPADLYRLTAVQLNDKEAQYTSLKDFSRIKSQPLLRPHNNRPIYIKSDGLIKVYGNNASLAAEQKTSGVTCDYIKKPATVVWAYNVVLGKAIYNASATDAQNFELHESEEVNLVNRILVLAGVMIEDPNLYKIAAAEEVKDIQQEKQLMQTASKKRK